MLRNTYIYQYLATITGSFSILSCGVNQAWTSPYLPQIINGSYPQISMTSAQGSWCAVMAPLSAPIGALIGALLVDRLGRKYTTLLMAPYTLIMFIFLAFANNLVLISLIRFVIGIVEGVLYTSLPMYLGEISAPEVRGILTASVQFGALLGTLLINVFGLYFSIFTTSLIFAAVPLLHFVTYFWMPESPYYLIKKNKKAEAKAALILLRGSVDVDSEMHSLCEAVSRQESDRKTKMSELVTVRSNRRALLIFVILCTTRKFSGNSPFLFYTAQIFQMAQGSLHPHLSVIIFLTIQIIAAMLSLYLLDRVGRRPIILSSTVVCVITLGIIGLYFYLQDHHVQYVENLRWLPITVLVCYIVFYNIGLELSPVVYVGELFPTNIKAIALGFAETFAAMNGIVTAMLFSILADNYGMFLPFWIFATCCAVGLLLIAKFVPETKNKTLEQIQMELIAGASKSNS
uniref:Major facilitator superfamily (MFS) profile domain-containing protein n=1 Tax=Photinus pyralis TaxID=7054 RepID=A0A1Y1MSZ0_PHOPY